MTKPAASSREARTARITSCACLLLMSSACPAAPAPSEATPDPKLAPAAAADRVGGGPEFVLAPAEGEVVGLVNAERERATADDRQLLVYVGASWCEPCQYFHDAVEDGSLDAVFPGLRLLEFNLDRDRERLAAAGYSSRLIPLFVAPGPDGRAGPRRSEGGIKGAGAVEHLRPRLDALLRASAADEN